jgi:hypothetical protein
VDSRKGIAIEALENLKKPELLQVGMKLAVPNQAERRACSRLSKI